MDGELESTTLGGGVHFGCISFVSHIATNLHDSFEQMIQWFKYFKVVREAGLGGREVRLGVDEI